MKKLSFEDKKNELINILNKQDVSNYLFYAARNNIIEMVLAKIENYFLLNGIVVKAAWEESSNYNPIITLETDLGKNKIYKETFFLVKRKNISNNRHLSNLYYYVEKVIPSHYSRYKKPQSLVDLEAFMVSPDLLKYVSDLVSKVNYPFEQMLDIEKSEKELNNFNPTDLQKLSYMLDISKENSIYTLSSYIKEYFLDKGIKVSVDINNYISTNEEITVSIKSGSFFKFSIYTFEVDNVPESFDNKLFAVKFDNFSIVKKTTVENTKFAECLDKDHFNEFQEFLVDSSNCMNFPFKYNSHSSF